MLEKDGVLEVVAAEEHAGDPDAGVEHYPDGDERRDDCRRRYLPRLVHAEDEAVKDKSGGEDDSRLEAAARPVVAVELYIQRK